MFFGVDPLHHAPQLLADLTSIGWFRSRRLMAWNVGWLALFSRIHSLANWPVWISCEDLLHLLLGLVGDDPRAAGVVAELGRVRDAVPHVVQAALVEQVDDQLQFVHAFEVGHFRLVAGFDQRFERGLDQGADAAAQDDLLAEQVGFGLLGEGGFDDAAAGAADAFGVGQRQLPGRFRRTGRSGDQAGHAAPFFVFAADQMPRPLGRDQGRIDAFRRNDLAEVDVEPVRAHQQVARLQVRPDVGRGTGRPALRPAAGC